MSNTNKNKGKNNLEKLIKKNTKRMINKETVEDLTGKETFNLRHIDISKIKVNRRNFYSIKEISELSENIFTVGLQQPLVINEIKENEEYLLISGHRRIEALKLLVGNGHQKFKLVPCKIEKLNEIDCQIALISGNALTRERSEQEKLIEVEQLKLLFEEKKKNGEKITGRIQDKISEILNISPSQVNKYSAISKGSEKLRKAFEEEIIPMRDASSIARLSDESQDLVIDALIENSETIKPHIEKIKKQLQKVEEEDLSQEEQTNKLKAVIEKFVNQEQKPKDTQEEVVFKGIKSLNKKVNKISDVEDIALIDKIMEEIKALQLTMEKLKKGIENK